MESLRPTSQNDNLKRMFLKKLNPKPQAAPRHRYAGGGPVGNQDGSRDRMGGDVLQPLHIRYTGSFHLDSESKVDQPVIKRKRIRNINQAVDLIDVTKLGSSHPGIDNAVTSLQRRRFRVQMMFEDSNKEEGLKKCRIKLHNVELLTGNSESLKETEVEQLTPLLDAIIKDIVGQVRNQIAETFKEEEETGIQCDLSGYEDEKIKKHLAPDDNARFSRKQVFNKRFARRLNDFEKDEPSTPQPLFMGNGQNWQQAEVMVDVQSTSRTARERQHHRGNTGPENCSFQVGQTAVPQQRENCAILTTQKNQGENCAESLRPSMARNEPNTCQKCPQPVCVPSSKPSCNFHPTESDPRCPVPPATNPNEAQPPTKNIMFRPASGIPMANENHSWYPVSKQQLLNPSNRIQNASGSLKDLILGNNSQERPPQASGYLQQHPKLLQHFQNRDQIKQEQLRKQQIFQLQHETNRTESTPSKMNRCVFLRPHHEAPVQHLPPNPPRRDVSAAENAQTKPFWQQPPSLITSRIAGASRYSQPNVPTVSRNNNQMPPFLHQKSQIRPDALSFMTTNMFDRMPAPRIRFSAPSQPRVVDGDNPNVRPSGHGPTLQTRRNQAPARNPQPILPRRHQQSPQSEVRDPNFIVEESHPNSRRIEDQKPSMCHISVEARQSCEPSCDVSTAPETARHRNSAEGRQWDHQVSQSPFTPTSMLDRNTETDGNSKHFNNFYCQTSAADPHEVIDSDREISTLEVSEYRQQDVSTSVFTEPMQTGKREPQCPQMMNCVRSNNYATSDAFFVNEMPSMTSWNEYTTGDETFEPVTEDMNGLLELSEQDQPLTDWMAACLPSEMSGGKNILHINDEPDLQLVSDHLDSDATANTHSVEFLDHCNQDVGSDLSKGVLSQWNECFPMLEYDSRLFQHSVGKTSTCSRQSNQKHAWKKAMQL